LKLFEETLNTKLEKEIQKESNSLESDFEEFKLKLVTESTNGKSKPKNLLSSFENVSINPQKVDKTPRIIQSKGKKVIHTVDPSESVDDLFDDLFME
jgi:hypothetical protein